MSSIHMPARNFWASFTRHMDQTESFHFACCIGVSMAWLVLWRGSRNGYGFDKEYYGTDISGELFALVHSGAFGSDR